MQIAISILAILMYLICTWQIGQRARIRLKGGQVACGRQIAIFWIIALILHGCALYLDIVTPTGLNLGVAQALSMVGWLLALIVLITLHNRPVEGLGLILLPFAALTIAIELAFPDTRLILHPENQILAVHIFISLVASSLFVIAALEAVLLWYQDRRLRTHRPGGWLSVLPPLQHTESILFQTLTLGFLLLTAALATGLLFITRFLSMESPQRTVLFIASWVVFGLLLLGRWRLGWRGRVAIRWTLSGFGLLIVAYLSTLIFNVLTISG